MPSVFGYWKIHGLGQAIRLLLEYVGEDYQDNQYDNSNGGAEWFEEKAANPHGLDFPNLPYYIDGEVKMTQSGAILRHVARKWKLNGRTEVEQCHLEMLQDQVFDQRLQWALLCYSPPDQFKTKLPGFKTTTLKNFKLLSDYLGNKKWFVGDRVTFIDFLMYDILTLHRALDPELLAPTQNLVEFVARFQALPKIKAYVESDRYITWPLNGHTASFGGK